MQRIFSGIQPSGVPTLGNYLGALRNWVALQDNHECIYCVVDLHAITAWQDPKGLAAATREMAAALLACGIDPARHILFNQSAVPAHARLGWIFTCVARLGWLNRMTQFKDQGRQGPGERVRRAVCVSEPDGRRHPRLPRHPRPRGRRPAAAPGAGERHRAEVQPRLPRGWRPGLLPRHRAADPRPRRPRDEPARRHEKDEQVRPFGPEPHQPDRRRRHHRP